jgi:exopolysaccharide biosynthesis polyprenyl glycosylphosphotransferase
MSQFAIQRIFQTLNLPLRPPRAQLGRLHISERRILLMLGDLLMISLALLAALWIRIPGLSTGFNSILHLFVMRLSWWLVLWVIWIPIAIIAELYELPTAASPARSGVYSAVCAAFVSLLYFLVPSISAPLTFSRLSFFILLLLATAGVGTWHVAYATLLSRRTFSRRVLIVGAGQAGKALAEAVANSHNAQAIELVGYIDDDTSLCEQEVQGLKVLATSEKLVAFAEQLQIDEIIVAITDLTSICPQLFDAIVGCWEKGISVVPMSLRYAEVTGAIPVEHIGQNFFALVNHQNEFFMRIWGITRRIIDILVGAIGLVLLIFLMPVIALIIFIDSPGPLFYVQNRVGRGGQRFRLAKFRSMIPDAEANGVQWALPDDSRITRMGRFMRKTHLDELPQLWNVFCGNMTLIGPRPERPEFVEQLDDLIPYYAIRHSIKPGITGWAQVCYPYGNCVNDSLMKLQYDLYYVKHRGPVLDMVIALRTIRIMATMRGM